MRLPCQKYCIKANFHMDLNALISACMKKIKTIYVKFKT